MPDEIDRDANSPRQPSCTDPGRKPPGVRDRLRIGLRSALVLRAERRFTYEIEDSEHWEGIEVYDGDSADTAVFVYVGPEDDADPRAARSIVVQRIDALSGAGSTHQVRVDSPGLWPPDGSPWTDDVLEFLGDVVRLMFAQKN